MKLYIANGTYCGTQVEAKAINKQFEQVEVPVDKAGLIEYLNALVETREVGVILGMEAAQTSVATGGEPVPSPMALDEAFENAPLSTQLRLAVVAIDAASANLSAEACRAVAQKEPYHPQPDIQVGAGPEDGSDLV